MPKDAPLPEGNTSGSAEGSMIQKELMELCTILSDCDDFGGDSPKQGRKNDDKVQGRIALGSKKLNLMQI